MSNEQEDGKKRLHYYFVKSNHFRVIYAEGAFGGVSPKGNVRMTLFSERFPLPQETIHEVSQDVEGRTLIGPELTDERVCKNGIIREMEADIVLPLDTAKVMHAWIGDRIKEIEGRQKQLANQNEE